VGTALYTAQATATAGQVRSDDGALDVRVVEAASAPSQDGGSAPSNDKPTNPEQLMAAALASCLQQALHVAATSQGADAADARVEATVELASADGPGYTSTFALSVSLPGLDGAAAQRVLDEATSLCPFTSALADRNLTVELA
jgi:lipoyl-dependent peroxiredoxin